MSAEVLTPDPMEVLLVAGMKAGGIRYVTEEQDVLATRGLDFYLPDFDVFIEAKQFHSPRIEKQMARGDNVIATQGRRATALLAFALSKGLTTPEEVR